MEAARLAREQEAARLAEQAAEAALAAEAIADAAAIAAAEAEAEAEAEAAAALRAEQIAEAAATAATQAALALQRAQGEAEERAPVAAPEPVPVPVPVAPIPVEEADWFEQEVEGMANLFAAGRTTQGLLLLLLGLALAMIAAVLVRRVRGRFPQRGVVPGLLAVAHLVVRLLVVGLALAFILRLLPPRLSLVMLLAFGGFAVALGWSMRDVLPDLVAGFVMAFEHRIRPGLWISGPGFSGKVEQTGLRSTTLRDAQGRRIDLPNRFVLQKPVVATSGHADEHEVLVRLGSDATAERIRLALRDAALFSPWVFPGSVPSVLRDPDDPALWRVQGRLLDATFGARFEGELLERAEMLLAAEAPKTPPVPEPPPENA
jgi:hypothetical protein